MFQRVFVLEMLSFKLDPTFWPLLFLVVLKSNFSRFPTIVKLFLIKPEFSSSLLSSQTAIRDPRSLSYHFKFKPLLTTFLNLKFYSKMGKRSRPQSPAGNAKKQQSLKTSFTNAANAAPALAPIDVANSNLPLLSQVQAQDMESALDNYCHSWGEKCHKESNLTRGGAAREDIDLDFRGMIFISAFNNAMALAAAQGVSMPPQFVEALVLIMRNDVIHQNTHVSRAAHATLMAYFKIRPYVKLGHYSTAGPRGSTKKKQTPFVSSSGQNVWLPMEKDRTVFTSKYLMIDDMAISGRNYKTEKMAGAIAPRHLRDVRWTCPAEMLLHCVEKARQSAEVDFNGDLMLFQYLITVMEQDSAVRLTVYSQLGGKLPGCHHNSTEEEEEGEEEEEAANNDTTKMEGPRRALLENSLVWRLFAGQLVSSTIQKDLIIGLVGLLVATADAAANDADIDEAEDEPEDDAPAGACVFTRPELAALAARLLRLFLSVFGAAEASGAFFATGKHRSAGVNHRMALDGYLLEALGSEKGICKTPDAARSLLRALPPHDSLRLIGLFAAQKFSKTYSEADVHGNFKSLVGDIGQYLHDMNNMLSRGTDVATFFQVDLCPVLASLHREPSRAIKTYKTADYIAGMISSIASAAAALDVSGKPIPTGSNGNDEFLKELTAAITSVATLGKGEKETGHHGLHLSKEGVCDLVCAQMTLKSMSEN